MKRIAIIPARYDSQRLPHKLLLELGGLPIICRVWQNITEAKSIDKAIVATDDARISDELKRYCIPYVMTDKELPSGTDRVFAALESLNESVDIILNVQGDEPFLSGEDIEKLLSEFDNNNFSIATFISKITDYEAISNPNVVKVVVSSGGDALYFSRSSVPYLRDYPREEWLNHTTYWKHIGIYAYTIDALKAFAGLPISNLEKIEKLEQLRLLENGFKFQCVELEKELIGIDTLEDYELAKIRFFE